MKQQLSPKAIAAAIAGVAVLLLVGAFLVFKDSFAPAPTIKPKPWAPSARWGAGGAGAPGQPGAPPPGSPGARFGGGGGPMGAPPTQQ